MTEKSNKFYADVREQEKAGISPPFLVYELVIHPREQPDPGHPE